MNFKMIVYIVGHIIKIESLLLLVPVITAVIYGEWQGAVYGILAIALYFIGLAITLLKPKNNVFYIKEGCVATALCWICLSLAGSIPLVITGEIPSFTDAMFEIVSGFTTTGSSILTDVEALSHASLIWRSFTHWVGGMGILIFLLAVIPLTGGSNVNLMKAESPGPQVDKSMPHVKTTAILLYVIYTVMTVLEFVALLLTGLPVFDSVCMSFGTAGTGGFGILNTSVASYPVASQWVIAVFMLLFGVNFNVYVCLIFRRFKNALKNDEIKVYLSMVICSIVVITINIYESCHGLFDALTKSTFQVASVVTTTGFSSTDFDTWPTLSKVILLLLMLSGACAGSTAGGLKVSRICIAYKTMKMEINSILHPREVKAIKMDGHNLDTKTLRGTIIYIVIYAFILINSVLLISFNGYDIVTTFTSVLATFNNIGPGLSMVGPTANFSFFSDFSKWVLIFDMLAGRLEIFPIIMLFRPSIWRGTVFKHRKTY